MDFARVCTKEFLLTHEGRINREPYWAFVLVCIAIAFGAAIVSDILNSRLPILLFQMALIYLGILVQIRRWHDRDKSGWWCLINLIPVIGPLWSLVECGFLPGTPGPNRFGPDPLASTKSVTTTA